MLQALRLYILSLKATAHRIFNDLLSEIVVAISSLVLFMTFLYVFNDFLNVQVASLSEIMRTKFASTIAWVLYLVAGLAGGRIARTERLAIESFSSFAKWIGAPSYQISIFNFLRNCTLIGLPHLAALALSDRYLFNLNFQDAVGPESMMLVLSLAVWQFPKTKDKHDSVDPSAPQAPDSMISWRLKQMLSRSLIGKICVAMSGLFVAMMCIAFLSPAPPFVGALAAYVAGNLIAFVLIFQTAEDLQYAWMERALGVSHADFVDCYNKIAIRFSFILGGTCFVLALICGIYSGTTAVEMAPHALKAAIIATLPILITPWLGFQIDARRPAIAIMIMIIVGIFLSTAVLAHWLGLVLVPILRYYAMTYQEGRFYRA